MPYQYFNRDLSWLSFNDRVLSEAGKKTLPLMERINFLSIYSSNLDEFFRVRMPALLAIDNVNESSADVSLLKQIREVIQHQQVKFGGIMNDEIVPLLKNEHGVNLLYKKAIPSFLKEDLTNYFMNKVLSFVRIIDLNEKKNFFPENNKLYILVVAHDQDENVHNYIVNIPSDSLPRFHQLFKRNRHYIVFLDDIVSISLPFLFKGQIIMSTHKFKVTRSAEFEIKEELEEDLADRIEREVKKRDMGLATRFLYDRKIDEVTSREIRKRFGLRKASFMKGGRYHNLKDLRQLPLTAPEFFHKPWPKLQQPFSFPSIFEAIRKRSFLIHTPYHSFDPLVRFFNEASIDPDVSSIYTTIYRIAKNSLIAHALISAAKHGKKVYVFVELKARFDEENNLKWAKKMEEAGVKITFSLPALKVHSKIALVKRKGVTGNDHFGIIGTGNFHENNAELYADHFYFTNDRELLSEVGMLFKYLRTKTKSLELELTFSKLLVAQFNLQQAFIKYIQHEIDNAGNSLPAAITLKMNSLEDKVLIDKLYDASNAGVQIRLIVRGICCLVPGIAGMSENITVTRIVDRYLEHGRIFIFENNGDPVVIIGSSDWMSRSMNRRIEVCFPVSDHSLKEELMTIINMQLSDNTQAVQIDSSGKNVKMKKGTSPAIQCQKQISHWLSSRTNAADATPSQPA